HLRQQTLDKQVICRTSSLKLAIHLHSQPKQWTTLAIIMSKIERGRAFRQALPPTGTDLNFEKAHAVRANLVLVRNSSGTKMNREGTELLLPSSVTLAVFSFEQKRKKRELVRMRGQFSRRCVPQIRKNGAALLVLRFDRAIEIAGAQCLLMHHGIDISHARSCFKVAFVLDSHCPTWLALYTMLTVCGGKLHGSLLHFALPIRFVAGSERRQARSQQLDRTSLYVRRAAGVPGKLSRMDLSYDRHGYGLQPRPGHGRPFHVRQCLRQSGSLQSFCRDRHLAQRNHAGARRPHGGQQGLDQQGRTLPDQRRDDALCACQRRASRWRLGIFCRGRGQAVQADTEGSGVLFVPRRACGCRYHVCAVLSDAA